MKRIGLISLALVLALGVLGVGYAAWMTDPVEIEQRVETGTLDVEIDAFVGITGDEKGYAGLEWGVVEGKTVTVTLTKLFPCLTVEQKFLITSTGSIPVHLTADIATTDTEGLFADMTLEWSIYLDDEAGPAIASGSGALVAQLEAIVDILEDTDLVQLHELEVLIIVADMKVEQVDEAQSKSASYSLTVTGTQYNY